MYVPKPAHIDIAVIARRKGNQGEDEHSITAYQYEE
jgi:hypothetical protein